jgi:D-xylose transport system ATP-binding protein
MPPREVLVSLCGVLKNYHALRPLRIQRLELRQGTSIALLGLDQAAAGVLMSLITGATIPDEGEVAIFGTPTRAITSADHWVRELDRFGLVNDRAVLLEQLTVEQNLALPLSLELDQLSVEVRAKVARLASEVGIARSDLPKAVSSVGHAVRVRLRVAKALALEPPVLLAEHPNALLPAEHVSGFAADLARIVANRGLAALVVTADLAFARAAAQEVLALQPATGELKPLKGWRRWLQ